MNSSQDQKKQLLGISTKIPPESLRKGSLFTSPSDYTSFLHSTWEEKSTFFKDLAKRVNWIDPPQQLGDVGRWFPEARINITACCLDNFIGQGKGDERVLWSIDNTSGEPIGQTRSELASRIGHIVKEMVEWGLHPGDPVLIALPASREMVEAMLACFKMGLTSVPVDPTYAGERIPRRARDAACQGIIFDPTGRIDPDDLSITNRLEMMMRDEIVGGIPFPVTPVSAMHPAFVLADSLGQLLTLPTAGFLVQAIAAYNYLLDGRGEGDVMWILAPSHHASSLASTIGALSCGGGIGILPMSIASEPEGLTAMIEKMRPRVLFCDVKSLTQAVRPFFDAGRRPRIKGPALLIIEGETLEPHLWHYIESGYFESGTHLVQVLSRPESGGFIAGPHPAITPVRPSSIALPAPGVELTVIDDQGGECELGQGGFLALRRITPGVALEFQQKELPFALPVKARRDRAGYLWSMGEAKVERSVESKVTLPELEAVIAVVEDVDQVAVVRYHDKDSNAVQTRAFIKPAKPREDLIDDVRAQIIEHCGEQAIPSSFELVTRLPYSRSGKLLRSVLRCMSKGEPLSEDDLNLVSDPEAVAEYVKRRQT